MKHLKGLVVGLALLAAHNSTLAEIYKTTDAEGNTVYTDSPDMAGASRVELRDINTADAPPPAPETEDPDSATPEKETPPAPPDKPTYQDPNADLWEERVRRVEEEASRDPNTRHQVRDAEKRHSVRDAEQRHSVRDAEQRNSVRDAEQRHSVRDAEQRHSVRDAEPRREVGN